MFGAAPMQQRHFLLDREITRTDCGITAGEMRSENFAAMHYGVRPAFSAIMTISCAVVTELGNRFVMDDQLSNFSIGSSIQHIYLTT